MQGLLFRAPSSQPIRHHPTHDALKTLICAFALSRIDYCNSLLAGCPRNLICKLQNVQNNAARLICRSTARSDHIAPILRALHWLPVESRSQYKIIQRKRVLKRLVFFFFFFFFSPKNRARAPVCSFNSQSLNQQLHSGHSKHDTQNELLVALYKYIIKWKCIVGVQFPNRHRHNVSLCARPVANDLPVTFALQKHMIKWQWRKSSECSFGMPHKVSLFASGTETPCSGIFLESRDWPI